MPETQTMLTNTPGIYYTLAYVLSSCLYIGLNPKRVRGFGLIGRQLLFATILGIFMHFTDGIYQPFFVPCVLFEIFLIWLSIFACCDMTKEKAAYFCARAFLLGEFAASLEWQISYYISINFNLDYDFLWNLTVLVMSHSAVYGLMFFLEKRYMKANAELQITKKDLRVSIFLGGFVYIISNMSYVFQNTPFSSPFPTEVFIIRTLSDLGGVCMLFAYHMQLQELHVKLEMESLQNILHMHYENYKISEESIALVNQKYHDLKHQIAILRATDNEEERNAYLDQMETEIKIYEAQNKTGHRVLDTILTTKHLQCQKLGISLTCVADGKELSFMHPMDISALFGNALDNAIEGVKKIGNPEKRLIHVSVARQKSFLRIRIENCYEGELEFENGMPKTTKKDKKYHGFGLKSIQRIAEKYNGSVTLDAKDGWFELRVLFPLETSRQNKTFG